MAKRVKASFATADGSALAEGTVVPDNHPLVQSHPGLFEDVEAYLARAYPHLQDKPKRGGKKQVEQATAAPGEKRNVSG